MLSTMVDAGELRYRLAGNSDVQAIAALHADSWRRHLRGAYLDPFLDGEVLADRLWREAGKAVVEGRPSSGLYLWVLEQNKAAQAFFDARGGICVGRKLAGPSPAGDVSSR